MPVRDRWVSYWMAWAKGCRCLWWEEKGEDNSCEHQLQFLRVQAIEVWIVCLVLTLYSFIFACPSTNMYQRAAL